VISEPAVGFAITIAIAVQNIPVGISVSVPISSHSSLMALSLLLFLQCKSALQQRAHFLIDMLVMWYYMFVGKQDWLENNRSSTEMARSYGFKLFVAHVIRA
jgi:zinc transporter ZupT